MSTLSQLSAKSLLVLTLAGLPCFAAAPPTPVKPVDVEDVKPTVLVPASVATGASPTLKGTLDFGSGIPVIAPTEVLNSTLKGPMTFEPSKAPVRTEAPIVVKPAQTAVRRSTYPRIRPVVAPTNKPEMAIEPKIVDQYADLPVYEVSDTHFNMFVFPAKIKKLHTGAQVPLVVDEKEKTGPIYLEGNRAVLLQFEKGSRGIYDVIVELDNGQVVSFYVKPETRPGTTIRVRGQTSTVTAEPATNLNSPTPEAVKLLEKFVQNKIPSEYQIDEPMATVNFQRFLAVPQVTYSNGLNRRVHIMQLVAVRDQETRVDASQFYRPGVLAALIDGDRIARDRSPLLYVVEEFAE